MKIHHVESNTPDLREELLRRLKELVPAAFSEGKLDVDALKRILGEESLSEPARYRLTWAGKEEALRILQKSTWGTLVPVFEESQDWDTTQNVIIEGENLETLKILLKPYYGRVKLIYIDPPYNTGKDFLYKDDYRNPKNAYLKFTGQADDTGVLTSNPETSGRYHSDWLSMMYPRLWLARELLREDGVLAVSIDDHEVHNLRILLDEIFGPENFRNTVIVRRGVKNVQAQFASIDRLAVGHEYILLYTKSPERRFSHLVAPLEEKRPGSWNLHWRGTDRPTMRYELFGITPQSGQWRWSRERSLKAIENYRQMLEEIGKPEEEITQEEIDEWYLRKVKETGEEIDLLRLSRTGKPEHYVPPTTTRLLNTLWTDLKPTGKRDLQEVLPSIFFDTPKPVSWIQRLLQMATDRDTGDIVLDFFAGSGTTAEAVLRQNAEDGGNRRFVLVQLPESLEESAFKTIADVAKARVRNVAGKLRDEGHVGLDLGFRVYRLEASQFKTWQEPEEDLVTQLEFFVESLKEGWNPEAVIAEVALKEAGFGLNYRVTTVLESPNRVYKVSDPDRNQHFYICLDDRFDLDAFFQLDLKKDTLFIVRDMALDDATVANLSTLCRLKTL